MIIYIYDIIYYIWLYIGIYVFRGGYILRIYWDITIQPRTMFFFNGRLGISWGYNGTELGWTCLEISGNSRFRGFGHFWTTPCVFFWNLGRVNWSISTGLNWWMWTSYHFHGELIPSKNVIFHRLPSGKHTKNYGKSPFFMGKSTINGPFSIAILT